MVVDWTWDEHMPTDCPPPGATAPTGVAYRFVAANPPSSSDFVPHALKMAKAWLDGRTSDERCEASGISYFVDPEDAVRTAKLIPALRRLRLAVATLDGLPGLTLATPRPHASTHTTWWVPVAASPWDSFALIKEI